MRIFKLFCILNILFVNLHSYSQIDTDDYGVSFDTYVMSGTNAAVDYSSTTETYFYLSLTRPATVYRTFLEYDFSTIPSNAIIISSELKLYSSWVNNGASHPAYLQRANSDWTSQSSFTWNTQPSVTTSDQISISHSETSSTGWHSFDVTNHVQKMVNYPEENFGWCLRLESESGASRGVKYLSEEYSGTTYDSYVTISYVLPIEISGNVTHCSNGNSDGSISPMVSEGTGNYVSYDWLKFVNGDTYVIESGSNIANSEVTGLDAGLYLFQVEDDSGYTNYKYFAVGEEGEETTIEIYANNADTAAMYGEDALTAYFNSTDDGDNTYPTYQWFNSNNSSYDGYPFFKIKVDFDYLMEPNFAELRLYSPYHKHLKAIGSSNAATVYLVMEDWDEYLVNYDTKPDVDDTVSVSLTETANNVFRDDTLDLINFVNYWQDNPNSNFGISIQLDSYTDPGNNRLIYGFTDEVNAVDRPKFVYKFEIKPTIETEFIDTLNKGMIEVNAPNGQLPYSFFLQHKPFTDLNDIWSNLNDSISIDSSDFWEGNINSQNFVYENLNPGSYFIGVFDSSGDLILEEQVVLAPELSLADTNLVIISSDTISVDTTGSNSQGHAVLNTIIPSDEAATLQFEVIQLDDEVVIGLNNSKDSRVVYDFDFEYAFKIKSNDTLEILDNGYPLDTFNINLRDTLSMQKLNGMMIFYKNGIELTRDTIPGNIPDYKTELLLKGSLSAIKYIIMHISVGAKVKKDISHVTCGKSDGVLTILESYFHGYELESITISDQNSTWDYTSASIPQSILIPFGVYNMHCVWSNGSNQFSSVEIVTIGYNVVWNQGTNINVDNNNSLTPTDLIAPYDWGQIQSVNQTSLTSNWIEFEIGLMDGVFSAINQGEAIIALQNSTGNSGIEVFFSTTAQGSIVAVKSNGIIQNHTSPSGYNSIWGGNVLLIPGQLPLRIEQDGFDFKLIHNGNTLYEFTSTIIDNENMRLDIQLRKNVKVKNVIGSFCFPQVPVYVQLQTNSDGGFYQTIDKVLKVEYDEEYNDHELVFKVFNDNSDLEDDQNSISINPISYGDNRIDFDFSGSNCIADGTYILEVTNAKMEKRYLRFKMINSGC
ncbi:MAG: DNRLRE domain-containing protein [Crocinitomicaceae bacterium]